MRRALLAAAGTVALGYAGCLLQSYEVTPAETTASAGGAGGAAGMGGMGGCAGARWPAPPGADDPSTDDVDFVVAVRTLDFGEVDIEPSGPAVGYDLDAVCTCVDEAPNSCIVPSYAAANHCDGPGGRDNAAAQLIDYASVLYPGVSSASLTSDLELGEWSVLVRVQGYNGTPNDTNVVASVFPSPGFQRDDCNPSAPAWDGDDRWPVSAFAIEGADGGAGGTSAGGSGGAGGNDCSDTMFDPALDTPRYTDANAYVSDGVLVASLPKAGLLLSTDPVEARINLVAGFLSARIAPSAEGWTLADGLLVGRWPSADMLGTLTAVISDGAPLCTDSPLYKALKTAACNYVDIEASLGGPTSPCDALSFGLSFHADPARLGIVFSPTSSPLACPDETDPAGDSCDAGER